MQPSDNSAPAPEATPVAKATPWQKSAAIVLPFLRKVRGARQEELEFLPAALEVVERRHLPVRTVALEGDGEGRADEAGAAGYQNPPRHASMRLGRKG